jgi:hypothetical protein
MSTFEKERAKYEKEKAQLQKNNEKCQKEKAEMQKNNEKIKKDNGKFQKEKAQLQKNNAKVKKENIKCQNNTKKLTTKLNKIISENKEKSKKLLKENDMLKTKNDILKNDNDILKTNITEFEYKFTDSNQKKSFFEDSLTTYLNTNIEKKDIDISGNISGNGNISGYSNIESFLEGMNSNEIIYNYNNVVSENKLLESQIKKNTNEFTTDDSKVFYKTQQYNFQRLINNILLWVFYILVLGLAIYLGFIDLNMSLYFKGFIVFVLIIYPFVIEYIEYLIYFIAKLIYSFFYGVPFTMNNYNGFIFVSNTE